MKDFVAVDRHGHMDLVVRVAPPLEKIAMVNKTHIHKATPSNFSALGTLSLLFVSLIHSCVLKEVGIAYIEDLEDELQSRNISLDATYIREERSFFNQR